MKIVFDLIKRTFYENDDTPFPSYEDVPPVLKRIDPLVRLDKMSPEQQSDFWNKPRVLDVNRVRYLTKEDDDDESSAYESGKKS